MTEYGRIHADGSRSGGQPVEAQQRALAIANTLLGIDRATLGELSHHELMMALVRIVPQHDAARQELSDFKQKVSDAVMQAFPNTGLMPDCLGELIIPAPKRDPLTEVWRELFMNEYNLYEFVAAMDARGLEIREKNDGQPNSN